MHRRRFSRLMLEAALGCAAGRRAVARHAPENGMPKFSCMLWTLEKRADFEGRLEIVARAGYQGVELVGEFKTWSPEETRRIVSRLHDLGLVVDAASGVKTGFATPGSETFLAELRAQLAAMRTFGCRRVILLSGPVVNSLSPAQQQQAALENLARAADLAAAEAVEIVIEPIDPLEDPTIYLQSVTQAFSLAKTLNKPNLKVLYDLYHEQRAFGNLTEKLQSNIDWVGLIHVADVPGRHEPGTGEIQYRTIYRTLSRLHYNGWIAMEFYPTTDPVATLRDARLAALNAQ